jgi:membrane protein implicated in regulation of membrane protease activity
MLLVLAFVAALLWLPSPLDWILVGVAAIVEIGETAFWFRWSRRRRAKVGVETLVGRQATVVLPCLPDGQVRLDGELWQARCEEGARTGEAVVVERVDGLTLRVRTSRSAI